MLVTTIGGAKGAVTLAVILSTPLVVDSGAPFPGREMLISVASIVILITLLLANFLLPVLAPRPKSNSDQREQDAQATLLILRNVMQRLPELADSENGAALTTVSQLYAQRIAQVREVADEDTTSSLGLRIDVVNEQISQMQGDIDGGKVDVATGMEFVAQLERIRDQLKQRKHECMASDDSKEQRRLERYEKNERHGVHRVPLTVWIRSLARRVYSRMTGAYSDDEEHLKLLVQSEGHAVEYLEKLQTSGNSAYPAEVVNEVLTQYATAYRRTQKQLEGGVQSEFASTSDQITSLRIDALGIELDEIRSALEEGDITMHQARHLRENVHTMRTDLEANIA